MPHFRKVWKPSMKLRQKGHSGGFLVTSQRRMAQSMHRWCSQPWTETSSSASRQMPQSSSSQSSGSNPAQPNHQPTIALHPDANGMCGVALCMWAETADIIGLSHSRGETHL